MKKINSQLRFHSLLYKMSVILVSIIYCIPTCLTASSTINTESAKKNHIYVVEGTITNLTDKEKGYEITIVKKQKKNSKKFTVQKIHIQKKKEKKEIAENNQHFVKEYPISKSFSLNNFTKNSSVQTNITQHHKQVNPVTFLLNPDSIIDRIILLNIQSLFQIQNNYLGSSFTRPPPLQ